MNEKELKFATTDAEIAQALEAIDALDAGIHWRNVYEAYTGKDILASTDTPRDLKKFINSAIITVLYEYIQCGDYVPNNACDNTDFMEMIEATYRAYGIEKAADVAKLEEAEITPFMNEIVKTLDTAAAVLFWARAQRERGQR